MSFTDEQITAAQTAQTVAAHDTSAQVRIVAGPGTGKSYSIGERVKWLLSTGVAANTIYAVSFTRAATDDLRKGIHSYCTAIPEVRGINVSTLHSLALSILARGGQLTQYATSPRILDDWEQRNIFDEELKKTNGFPIKKCGELRTHFEAIWSTGSPPLPFISDPSVPLSNIEIQAFSAFHSRSTQIYACLLPGEAVRKCVDQINGGLLDPRALLGMDHLIVDEYQDLNNCDVEFIDSIARSGVTVLVSGDDDQSIYSFRYAYPTGIQTFTNRYTNAGQHALQLCFRCTPSVLGVATNILINNSSLNRIPKSLQSAYSESEPSVQGSVTCLRFSNYNVEAQAIAQSVNALIEGGLPPKDILILLSSRRAQLGVLESAMESAGILLDVQKKLELSNHKGSRLVYAMLRLLRNSNDYLAFRTILGLRSRVGIGTCVGIANKVLANSLNYRRQFVAGQTATVFTPREISAITGAIEIVDSMQDWSITDLLGERSGEIANIINTHISDTESNAWRQWSGQMPENMTLEELESIFGSSTEKDVRKRLNEIYTRLDETMPDDLDPSERVRVMTLHSSKGLGSKVVFIPGLEEELLPGPKRAPYAGQVQEAARLLYVGITRSKAACIISFAGQRFISGKTVVHHPSRFAPHLGVTFQNSHHGLSPDEINEILANCSNLS